MIVRQLRTWLNEAPEEFDEYSVIFRTYQNVEGTDLELLSDKPLVAIFADKSRREFCFIDNESLEELERMEKIIDDNNI